MAEIMKNQSISNYLKNSVFLNYLMNFINAFKIMILFFILFMSNKKWPYNTYNVLYPEERKEEI